jgi:hypothetical protein
MCLGLMDGQFGGPITSAWKVERASRIFSALCKMLAPRSEINSCIWIVAHLVIIIVPYSIKSVTISCSCSFSDKKL